MIKHKAGAGIRLHPKTPAPATLIKLSHNKYVRHILALSLK